MTSVLLLGFLIGMRHALEADHVAAVASLTTQVGSRREALRLGATWGVGHTITLLIFGCIVLFSGEMISDSLARWLETAVGFMLVALGVDVFRRLRGNKRVHFHVHTHADGVRHFHAHVHEAGEAHDATAHEHEHVRIGNWKALFVGMMHGMAGSAALILLVLQTVHSPILGLGYILLFGLGSIAGMAALALAVSLPLRYSANRLGRYYHYLQASVACVAIYIGIEIVMDTGVIEGLMHG